MARQTARTIETAGTNRSWNLNPADGCYYVIERDSNDDVVGLSDTYTESHYLAREYDDLALIAIHDYDDMDWEARHVFPFLVPASRYRVGWQTMTDENGDMEDGDYPTDGFYLVDRT